MSQRINTKEAVDQAAALQVRTYNRNNTVTPGWCEWRTVNREQFDEICYYIEHGWLFYQVRILTASQAMCHVLSPPNDCQGKQVEGIANNFVGNPFSFRK